MDQKESKDPLHYVINHVLKYSPRLFTMINSRKWMWLCEQKTTMGIFLSHWYTIKKEQYQLSTSQSLRSWTRRGLNATFAINPIWLTAQGLRMSTSSTKLESDSTVGSAPRVSTTSRDCRTTSWSTRVRGRTSVACVRRLMLRPAV